MEADLWIDRVSKIRRHTKAGLRAPHKPLLLLLALGKLQQGLDRIRFADVVDQLEGMLTAYGPPSRQSHPEYPFFYLQTDGLWTVATKPDAVLGSVPSRAQLLTAEATGELTSDFRYALTRSPLLLAEVAGTLLDENFPESLHSDICVSAELTVSAADVAAPARSRRSTDFREKVLVAYEYTCAICGYDGALSIGAGLLDPVGLEAAHVRWWSEDGPDDVANGLCLCSLHHKLLDRGAIGIGPDYSVQVSTQFVGRSSAARVRLTDFAGAAVRRPKPGASAVEPQHVAWHTAQVFRGPARPPLG